MSKNFIIISTSFLFILGTLYLLNSNNCHKLSVLRISSCLNDDPWGMSIEKGVQKALLESGLRYNYRLFYMDNNGHPEKEWLSGRTEQVKNLIRTLNPDAVIVSGDIANQYISIYKL